MFLTQDFVFFLLPFKAQGKGGSGHPQALLSLGPERDPGEVWRTFM